jgi:hypothetical protein
MGHYSDPPLLVLASLASGPKHGRSMIEDIERLCGTRLGPGTLYGAISRLEQQGWIEPLPVEERRQPYRITVVTALTIWFAPFPAQDWRFTESVIFLSMARLMAWRMISVTNFVTFAESV